VKRELSHLRNFLPRFAHYDFQLSPISGMGEPKQGGTADDAGRAIAACASLVAFALLRPDWVHQMGPVAVALGGIGVVASGSDPRRFAGGPPPRMTWLTIHLSTGSWAVISQRGKAFSTVITFRRPVLEFSNLKNNEPCVAAPCRTLLADIRAIDRKMTALPPYQARVCAAGRRRDTFLAVDLGSAVDKKALTPGPRGTGRKPFARQYGMLGSVFVKLSAIS
jgi:hypothetical protein